MSVCVSVCPSVHHLPHKEQDHIDKTNFINKCIWIDQLMKFHCNVSEKPENVFSPKFKDYFEILEI